MFNRGDIVISKSPKDPSMMICKRVAAIEGDRIKTAGIPFQRAYVSNDFLHLPTA